MGPRLVDDLWVVGCLGWVFVEEFVGPRLDDGVVEEFVGLRLNEGDFE